jgi:hydrogenase expression/formation protein HypC
MCLGVPGKVLAIRTGAPGMPMGKIDFGGVAKEACLAYVPEAAVGDYVIVHAGFALSRLDEEEAREVFALLDDLAVAAELEELGEGA